MPVFRRRTTTLVATALLAVASFASTQANAGVVIPELTINWTINGANGGVTPGGTSLGNGLFNYTGNWNAPNGDYALEWNLNADVDPFVAGNLVAQNFTNNILNVDLTITLPVSALPGANLMGGSATAGFTSDSGGGQLLSLPNQPAWNGMIDGVDLPAAALLNPLNLTHAGLGSSSQSDSFGNPIPSAPAPAVASSIGIHLRFTLTPNDQASFTSVFVVVPAPGALALLGLGAFVGTRRRRD